MFFTWNVHKNVLALELSCKHLSRCEGPVIAALQEVPHPVRDQDIRNWSAGKLKLFTGLPAAAAVEPSHHVVLIGSTGIDVGPARSHELAADHDSERRMQGLSLFSGDGTWPGPPGPRDPWTRSHELPD